MDLHTLSTLFIARMIAGMGTANIGTARQLSQIVQQNRSKGMGLIEPHLDWGLFLDLP